MMFGPNDETKAAFADARRTLARYPSDRALLDLMVDATNRVPEKPVINNAPERFLMGAAAAVVAVAVVAPVALTVTGNPRFSTCTRVALSYG